MRTWFTILILLLLISSAFAQEIKQIEKPKDKENKHFPINLTNSTNETEINITIPINNTNITINDTLINLTNITINETNITINTTLNLTNITINDTNLTIPTNLTNTTINLTNSTTNETNSSMLDITGLDVVNITEELQETNTKGKATTYFYAGDKLLASKEDNEINYYYTDKLETNRIITDEQGNIIDDYISLPFGQEITTSNIRFSFTNKEKDSSGLYNFGARYYDFNPGRFTSIDPFESEPDYQYVKNNPVTYIDPTGEKTDINDFVFDWEEVENKPEDKRLFLEFVNYVLKKGKSKLYKALQIEPGADKLIDASFKAVREGYLTEEYLASLKNLMMQREDLQSLGYTLTPAEVYLDNVYFLNKKTPNFQFAIRGYRKQLEFEFTTQAFYKYVTQEQELSEQEFRIIDKLDGSVTPETQKYIDKINQKRYPQEN